MTMEEVRAMKEQLDRIERCLVGDANMGHRGLVQARDNHETRISALERVGLYLGGGGALLGVLWALYTQWPRK